MNVRGDFLKSPHSTNTTALICKSRKENPQKLTQLSSRSHPRHLVGKRTAQKDTIIDITSLPVGQRITSSCNIYSGLCLKTQIRYYVCKMLNVHRLFEETLGTYFWAIHTTVPWFYSSAPPPPPPPPPHC